MTQAYKSWDPNNYASIPGWGGNAKYYNQLLALKKDDESSKEISNKAFGATGQSKKTDFAMIASTNVLG